MRKGFTLIELLIVIAIVAILSAGVVLVLNPAELLKQSRDATRISDLGTLVSAISLYLSDVSSPNIGAVGSCYVSTTSALAASCAGRHTGRATVGSASRVVTGSGWIPVALSGISFGAPISVLPVDPGIIPNNATYFYSYAAIDPLTSALVFELTADLESQKFITQYEGNDGGSSGSLYEVGIDPGLDL